MEKLILIILISLVTGITGNYHSYSQSNLKSRYSAGFLISDGTLPLDYAGAYEVLGQSGMKVFTIGRTTDTVKLSSNMQILPNYSIDNVPEFNILVVPSAFDNDTVVIKWIKDRAEKVEYILTVCGGVTPVYDAGLLDGKTITSYGPLIDHLKSYAKNANVVTDKRFVDNGKIITCGSYVSGIDGALYLVSKIYGEPKAQEVANNIEYNWDKEYNYVRAKLADNWLVPLCDFNPPLRGKTLKYEGDENGWVAEYETTRKESFREFYVQVPGMTEMHNWKNLESVESDDEYSSKWTRQDFNNRQWICDVTIKKLPGEENKFLLQYVINLQK
ncbi:MAG TPA: DJ-1/PfpI family protein [Ignavibacteria bacterium]|nr:DJ-1/PfpI family protein [Ignavibacteria bacterium]